MNLMIFLKIYFKWCEKSIFKIYLSLMYIYFLLVWEPIFDWSYPYKFNPLNFVYFNQAKSTHTKFY